VYIGNFGNDCVNRSGWLLVLPDDQDPGNLGVIDPPLPCYTSNTHSNKIAVITQLDCFGCAVRLGCCRSVTSVVVEEDLFLFHGYMFMCRISNFTFRIVTVIADFKKSCLWVGPPNPVGY